MITKGNVAMKSSAESISGVDFDQLELRIAVLIDELAKLDGRKPYNRPMSKAEYGEDVTVDSLEKKYGMPLEALRKLAGQ